MDKVIMYGQMEENMLASGKIIICMAVVSIHGKMVANMMATIIMIANMALEFTPGKMGGNTKETGTMENNTEKAYIDNLMALRDVVAGRKEKEWLG